MASAPKAVLAEWDNDQQKVLAKFHGLCGDLALKIALNSDVNCANVAKHCYAYFKERAEREKSSAKIEKYKGKPTPCDEEDKGQCDNHGERCWSQAVGNTLIREPPIGFAFERGR